VKALTSGSLDQPVIFARRLAPRIVKVSSALIYLLTVASQTPLDQLFIFSFLGTRLRDFRARRGRRFGSGIICDSFLGLLCVWGWGRYQDYKRLVDKPACLADINASCFRQLSRGLKVYDYTLDNGSKNLSAWIDTAAQMVGR